MKPIPPMLQARFLTRELKEHCDLISELSSESARSLKENLSSDTLSLNHIKEITADTAKEITGEHSLELNGISELNKELAEVLGDHRGSLILDSITDVAAHELEALTKKPKKLSLRSLRSLPFGGLKNLEKRKDVTLRLFSLRRLSEAKATCLARLPIHIVLDSGSSLSLTTIDILAKGSAKFTITDPDDTGLDFFTVQISTGYSNPEDILTLTGTHPTISTTWNAIEGKLILEPNAPATQILYEDLQTAVREIVFSSTDPNITGEKFFSLK